MHLGDRLDVIEFEWVGGSASLRADGFASRIREISRGGRATGRLRVRKAGWTSPLSQNGTFQAPLAESLPRDRRFSSSELGTGPLATHRAFNPASRGLFGLFVRIFPRVFGAPGGTCTNRPNRGGTAAALTIGPAATSLFRRASTCRFRPSKARAPSGWRSPASAKTTSSTVSDLSTISTA
jgi:hypothetical protein